MEQNGNYLSTPFDNEINKKEKTIRVYNRLIDDDVNYRIKARQSPILPDSSMLIKVYPDRYDFSVNNSNKKPNKNLFNKPSSYSINSQRISYKSTPNPNYNNSNYNIKKEKQLNPVHTEEVEIIDKNNNNINSNNNNKNTNINKEYYPQREKYEIREAQYNPREISKDRIRREEYIVRDNPEVRNPRERNYIEYNYRDTHPPIYNGTNREVNYYNGSIVKRDGPNNEVETRYLYYEPLYHGIERRHYPNLYNRGNFFNKIPKQFRDRYELEQLKLIENPNSKNTIDYYVEKNRNKIDYNVSPKIDDYSQTPEINSYDNRIYENDNGKLRNSGSMIMTPLKRVNKMTNNDNIYREGENYDLYFDNPERNYKFYTPQKYRFGGNKFDDCGYNFK